MKRRVLKTLRKKFSIAVLRKKIGVSSRDNGKASRFITEKTGEYLFPDEIEYVRNEIFKEQVQAN